jgi:hypothetical protein
MEYDEIVSRLKKAGFTISIRDDVEPAAAAFLLGCTVKTLANRRSRGLPPAYVRLACGTRYPIAGLLEHLDSQVQNRAA